jgi:purine-binding chemotaxis protein CheW
MSQSMPPTETSEQGAEAVALLTFRIGEMGFAVSATSVQRVAEMTPLTPLPRAPDHVPGMVLAGARAVPVLDLGRFLGIASNESYDEASERLVIVAAEGLEVALRCSGVRIERDVAANRLRDPTVVRGGRLQQFTAAEMEDAGELFVLLDLGKLLGAARPRT